MTTLWSPGGAADDEGDRVDDAADRGAVAVEATRHRQVYRRIALDLDAVAGLGSADRHRQVEHDLGLFPRLHERNLVEAENPALRHAFRFALGETGSIVSGISSIGRPSPRAMIAADSERPTWPSFFSATPRSNSSRVSPAPTLARSGPRRLAASTTRVTFTEST